LALAKLQEVPASEGVALVPAEQPAADGSAPAPAAAPAPTANLRFRW